MSLKGFHLVFITVSLLLFGFLVVWGFVLAEDKDSVAMSMGLAGILGLLVLPFYAVYFLKKARSLAP